ncbi:MAG: hypothetical protein KC636_24130 [Myxococcales bacterium]|nr:hypothetical protein [Myxococcales bacterium]
MASRRPIVAAVIFAVVAALATVYHALQPYRLGLDFEGGAIWRLAVDDPADLEVARASIARALAPVEARALQVDVVADRVWISAPEPPPALEAAISELLHGVELRIQAADLIPEGGPDTLVDDRGQRFRLVDGPTLSARDVAAVEVFDEPITGGHGLALTLTADGGARLEALTRARVRDHVAVVVDGRLLTAPMVMEPITDGRVHVNVAGDLDEAAARAEALRLRDALQAALPVKLTLDRHERIASIYPRWRGAPLLIACAVVGLVLALLALLPGAAWLLVPSALLVTPPAALILWLSGLGSVLNQHQQLRAGIAGLVAAAITALVLLVERRAARGVDPPARP